MPDTTLQQTDAEQAMSARWRAMRSKLLKWRLGALDGLLLSPTHAYFDELAGVDTKRTDVTAQSLPKTI